MLFVIFILNLIDLSIYAKSNAYDCRNNNFKHTNTSFLIIENVNFAKIYNNKKEEALSKWRSLFLFPFIS